MGCGSFKILSCDSSYFIISRDTVKRKETTSVYKPITAPQVLDPQTLFGIVFLIYTFHLKVTFSFPYSII